MMYPTKATPLQSPIHDLLAKRWSPMAFSAKPVEPEKIASLLEALRWAPSSYNEQPWRVIYATKDEPEEYEQLSSLLAEGNSWAVQAYMLILACAVPVFSRNGKRNRHHQYDTGAAMENLFLQAVALDLVGHQMAGFSIEKAHAILGVPDDVVPMAMMAVGYPGNPEDLPDDWHNRQDAPRQRKAAKELVYRGRWQG